MDTNATSVEAFLTLSPEAFGAFTSPPPPSFAAQDYVFAQPTTFESPSSSSSLHSASSSTNNISLAFPQVSHEYPPLMSPEIMQLFGNSSADLMFTSQVPPFMMVAHDFVSHPITLSFPPELLAQVATPTVSQNGQLTGQCTIVSHPHLDLKGECPSEAPWLSYMQEVLSHPLPFQSSLSCATISPKATELSPSSCQLGNATPSPSSIPSSTSFPTVQHIKQENAQQSSALQKLHQRLLQRLRKSQQDCPTQDHLSSLSSSTSSSLPSSSLSSSVEPTQVVISESSKKADSSFNKVLELFSYYFNTQKTASPLACTAALYLGQVGFELQKRYEAYSRYIKCGVLEEMLVSITRATNLRKLGIKSYEEFLRAEVSELRRIKDPERYLNRRMQVFQSYEPEELEGVYLSFDALYLLAKKPPAFRTEWLEEGKVRIVHICEIHEAWRGSPLNKTKRARSPESEETSDGCTMPKAKVLKEEH